MADSLQTKQPNKGLECSTACFMMRVRMAFGSSLSSMDVDIVCDSNCFLEVMGESELWERNKREPFVALEIKNRFD